MIQRLSDKEVAQIKLQIMLLCPEAVEGKEKGGWNIVKWVLVGKFQFFVDQKFCAVFDERALASKDFQEFFALTPEEAIAKLVEILHVPNC